MATRGVWQLKRLLVKFCDHGGSSRGAREFLETRLEGWQALNPQLEVQPTLNRGKHPHLVGHFANGSQKVIDLRNRGVEEVEEQAQRLRDSTGRKVKKLRSRQHTKNPSVQGTWSPGWQQ